MEQKMGMGTVMKMISTKDAMGFPCQLLLAE